jgi:membrane protein YqaA with SNARE-associated domain
MVRTAATVNATRSASALGLLAQKPHPNSPLLHLLFSLGFVGLFFVSIVDSSFVPLPLPGITDIMLVVLTARHANIILLLIASTSGSALGGYLSYRVGHSGGIAFLEKRVPPRIFNLVQSWMERHAILAIALPAILHPPMPLSPFVLAAGALRMSRKTFMTTFTISRCLRHAIAIWLGIRYGRHVVRLWNRVFAEYATPIQIILWTAIIGSAAFAFWKLYKTSRTLGTQPKVTGESHTTA